MNKIKTIIIKIVCLILIFNFSLASNAFALGINNSSLNGLINLKQMAKEATPYQIAVNDNKPIFLEFYADWCTTCQSMAITVNKLHQKYNDQIDFVMINIDDPQWQEQIKEYQVTGIPQFNILDTQHHNIKTFIGKVPRSILIDYLPL